MNIITIDFETYYSTDLGFAKQTTEEYVRDPRFEVIGVAVQVDNGEPVWCSGDYGTLHRFLHSFDWADSLALAHNAVFDGAILNWVYGIKPKGWLDTLSMGRALHGTEVGGSLKVLANFYNVGVKGTEVEDAKGLRREDFTDTHLAIYGEYCKNDVRLTHSIFLLMSNGFPAVELRLIDLTIRMFTEPTLELDADILKEHLQEVKDKKRDLLSKMLISKDQLMSNPQLAKVLGDLGVTVPMKVSPATGKPTYAFAKSDEGFKALLDHENVIVQAIVAARLGVKSTLAETRTERFVGIAERGTLPVPLRYYAAHTGRWGGDGSLNLQNLPRGSALKKAIKAPQGYMVLDSDSSQIEARTLAWLAGQDDLLKAFEDGEDVYKIMAAAIYGKSIEEITKDERFVGKTTILGCIGAGSMVLCESGWKPIEQVTLEDKLWDGEEWVCHQGLVPKGEKETLSLSGLWLTPDHKVLCGTQWLEAQSVVADASILYQALGTGAVNLPLRGISRGKDGACEHLSFNVTVGYQHTPLTTKTSKISKARDAIFALKNRPQKLVSCIGGTPAYYPTTNIESAYLTGCLPLLAGAIPQLIGHTPTTEGEVYPYTNNGEKTGPLFLSMCKYWRGGIYRALKWTGLMSTATMSLTTSGLCLEATTLKTNAKLETSKKLLPTYDVAYAGPRNRYTVLTAQGAMIVHNCGYGMGAAKFKAQLKNFGVEVELEEAQRIITTYRNTYPKITQLWRDAGVALKAILQKKHAALGRDDVLSIEGEDGIQLPNGLYIRYPNLRWYENEEGKAEIVYDTKKGRQVIPNRIYGGKVVENCIARGTEVLTDMGWTLIEDIKITDKVYDGVEFVTHGGMIYKSTQPCVTIDGVYMTPDHEVLTNDGWKAASQNPQPYRPDLRHVTGAESRAQRWKKTVLAFSVPMREAMRQGGSRYNQGDKAGRDAELRMCDQATHSQGQHNPRYEQASGIRRMEVDAGSLSSPYASGMGKLWWSGYQCVRTMAGVVREFLVGYGANLRTGLGFGSYGQRRPLLTGELSMDFPTKQCNEQAQHRAQGGHSSLEQANRDSTYNSVLPTGTRMARRSIDAQAQREKLVYDILNAGPRSRFVVRGTQGPFIVHNCCQALARIIIGEQMLMVAKKYRVVMTVHDAIASIVPEHEVETAQEYVEACMRMRPKWALKLPLDCEAGYGKSYGEC